MQLDSWTDMHTILLELLERSRDVDAILKKCGSILRCKPSDVPDRVVLILRQINLGAVTERKQKSLYVKLNSIRVLIENRWRAKKVVQPKAKVEAMFHSAKLTFGQHELYLQIRDAINHARTRAQQELRRQHEQDRQRES